MDLLPLRTRGDPLADDALAALKRAPRPGENILDRVSEGARRGVPALVRFMDETRALPAWADPAAYVAGRRAMMRNAPATFLVMLCGSLVESFAMSEGAAVLVRSGRLIRDAEPRIYETASLVRDMMLDGAEQPGGRAHTSLLRVRLLHAAVRRWVGRKHDVAALGVPVNQMDMAHTLLMFSRVVVHGLRTLGLRVTDEERASWCALWRLGGHLVGVDPSVVPANVGDEDALYAQVRAHYRPDHNSQALARAVLGAIAGRPPFFLPEAALHAIARRMMGEALGDRFDLIRSRRWSAATGVARGLLRTIDRAAGFVPFAHDAGVLGGRAFIEVNRVRVLRKNPEADYSFRVV